MMPGTINGTTLRAQLRRRAEAFDLFDGQIDRSEAMTGIMSEELFRGMIQRCRTILEVARAVDKLNADLLNELERRTDA